MQDALIFEKSNEQIKEIFNQIYDAALKVS
jgi:hypothetical protein